MLPAQTPEPPAAIPEFPTLARSLSRSAARTQATSKFMIFTSLAAIIGSAVASISNAQSPVVTIASLRLNLAMGIAALLFLIAVTMYAVRQVRRLDDLALTSRDLAEEVRSLAWRYAVGGNPFNLHDSAPGEDDHHFVAALDAVARITSWSGVDPSLPRWGRAPNSIYVITPWMRQQRSKDLVGRRAIYASERILDLHWFFMRRSRTLFHAAAISQWVAVSLMIVGVVLAVLNALSILTLDVVAGVATVVACVIAWTQFNQSRARAIKSETMASRMKYFYEECLNQRREWTESRWADFVNMVENRMAQDSYYPYVGGDDADPPPSAPHVYVSDVDLPAPAPPRERQHLFAWLRRRGPEDTPPEPIVPGSIRGTHDASAGGNHGNNDNIPSEEVQHVPDPQFAVFSPREVEVERWSSLFAYAFVKSALNTVRDDVKRFRPELGARHRERIVATEFEVDAGQRITFEAYCEGVEFNEQRKSFRWFDDWYREVFNFKAPATLAGKARNGEITVFADQVIIAVVEFSLLFSAQGELTESGSDYEISKPVGVEGGIFASYSHEDKQIMRMVRRVVRALGIPYNVDIDILRSGDDFDEVLMKAIEDSPVFQLFWSDRAARSKYVEREWRHALQHDKGKRYIRPFYWEEPCAPKPDELRKREFTFMALDD